MDRDVTDDHIYDLLRLNTEFRASPNPIRFAELLSAMDDLVWDLWVAQLPRPGDGIPYCPEPDSDNP